MSTSTVSGLLSQAKTSGNLSPAVFQALNIVDVGAQFDMGVPPDDFGGTEAVLVTIMPDDSGSIRFAGNADAVRSGHNQIIDDLSASKQSDHILMSTQYLNGFVLNPFVLLQDAKRLDKSNYDPSLGTPLYDNTIALLSGVLAKTEEYENNGIPVRTVTLIVTDGHDEGSRRATAADVAVVVKDMIMSEKHIVAGMGIDDGGTDFRQVFAQMGIRDEWILTPGNTPTEVRRAFAVFSKSAVRASQTSGASFSQVALGGFASP